MLLRQLRAGDIPECLEVQPARMGTELVGREAALQAWSELSRSRSFTSLVIESDLSPRDRQIVGFGASVFVSPAFAREEVANPRPGLNARIIESIVRGSSVVLTEPELGSGNTSGELHLVLLYGCFRRSVLTPEEIAEGYTLMGSKFVENHIGYGLNQIINEAMDEIEREHSWGEISTYEEFWAANPTARWSRSRALSAHSRGSSTDAGFMMNLLFRRRKAVLQLRDADQELLIAALSGMTDEELAVHLGKNLPAIKKRWLSLFERTVELRPDLFPEASQESESSKRGKQKGHHLLAYVRINPQELRPTEIDVE